MVPAVAACGYNCSHHAVVAVNAGRPYLFRGIRRIRRLVRGAEGILSPPSPDGGHFAESSYVALRVITGIPILLTWNAGRNRRLGGPDLQFRSKKSSDENSLAGMCHRHQR